jgi:hypothetical protein
MRRELLAIDGLVNLTLGVLLISYPQGVVAAFGLPTAGRPFFASMLGGVLLGVGVALFLERRRPPSGLVGLGLGGAVAINLCAGLVLAAWLVAGALELTALGQVALWALVVLLVGLSGVELYTHLRHSRD